MEFDDRELTALAVDLSGITGKTLPKMRAVFSESADLLRDGWRDNARETSGDHGRFYPDSITAGSRFSSNLDYEVGPEVGRKQGAMGPGFEFGSINQEPHLDGQRAADKLAPLIDRAVTLAAEGLFDA